MTISRRHVAAIGVLTFGVSGLLAPTAAADKAGESREVAAALEVYRKALLTKDKLQLERVAAEQLSYGHSSGMVQNKAEFVSGVMNRKAVVKSLEFLDVKIAMAGEAAIVRHTWHAESELDGKPVTTKIGVLMVWQEQDGDWKLLARQGYKLA